MSSIKTEIVKREILELLAETFENPKGIYLDKGSSVFETLNEISCIKASEKFSRTDSTISSQVFHLKFYIIVIQEYLDGTREGKTDWKESWEVISVNKEEWKSLISDLESEYKKLVKMIQTKPNLDKEDILGGVLSILVHSAYHLGSIRQMIRR